MCVVCVCERALCISESSFLLSFLLLRNISSLSFSFLSLTKSTQASLSFPRCSKESEKERERERERSLSFDIHDKLITIYYAMSGKRFP